jgi:hypothetical protein
MIPDLFSLLLFLAFFLVFPNLENPEATGERLSRQLRLPRQPALRPLRRITEIALACAVGRVRKNQSKAQVAKTKNLSFQIFLSLSV